MEFLVWIIDQGPDEEHFKAGDVIDYQPNGSFWGKAIEAGDHPGWRIIRADVPQTMADASVSKAPKSPRQRDWRLNLALIPSDIVSAADFTKALVKK